VLEPQRDGSLHQKERQVEEQTAEGIKECQSGIVTVSYGMRASTALLENYIEVMHCMPFFRSLLYFYTTAAE
jgi:hypothetical protein